MYIKREISDYLQNLANHFPAVILTGARQTGKTTLLQHLFPQHRFVSLDLPQLAELAEKNPQEFFTQYPPPVIIDEIQYAPGLFRHLKILLDKSRHQKGRFLLTGSQKFSLMKEVSESLAGRCAILELDTLSAQEFQTTRTMDPVSWLQFLLRGGFPELAVEPNLPAADFYRSYVATYLERDVRSLLQIGNLRDFDRFIRMCAARCAQLLNLSELAKDIGISPPTAKQWLSVLQASNQIDLLEPHLPNRGQRLVKTPKLYFRDTGLLCFLLGLSSAEQFLNTPLSGAIWENFVYGQLSRGLRTHSTATTLWFWRDTYGLEADFLLDHGDRFTLVEAKWQEQPGTKDAKNLEKIIPLLEKSRPVKGMILCRTPHSYPLTKTTTVQNGFLQTPLI